MSENGITYKGLGTSAFLWALLMAMNTSPLLFDNYWFNMTLLHLIAPIFINKLMKGGAFFGYASLDFQGLVVISFLAYLFAILVTQVFDKKIQEHYRHIRNSIRVCKEI